MTQAHLETVFRDSNLVLFFTACVVLIGLAYRKVSGYWLRLPSCGVHCCSV